MFTYEEEVADLVPSVADGPEEPNDDSSEWGVIM